VSYYVRPMRPEDVSQVNAIDREAFPTQWPPLDYRRELQAQLTRHIVVCEDVSPPPLPEMGQPPQKKKRGLFTTVMKRLNFSHLFHHRLPRVAPQRVLGFASLWVIADEAHLTNIAVRKDFQRRGLGDLLLIAIIELAATLKADFVTLEVRVSNLVAQNLYKKYGFTQVGLRHGYYTDNREDAVLMSTESLNSPSFQKRFAELKQAYQQKYGSIAIKLD